MKVTLFFCLLAVYGAVAQDVVDGDVANNTVAGINADAIASNASSSVSNIVSKMTPGAIMGHINSMADFGTTMKESIVNGSVGIGQTAVEMAVQATGKGLDGAKAGFLAGMEAAENVKTSVTSGVKNITGQAFGLVNTMTMGKASSIVGGMNSTAQNAISFGDKAASMGINVASNVAAAVLDTNKAIVGKIGGGISSVMGKGKSIDKAINNKIVSGIKAGTGFFSNLGQAAGIRLTSAFKIPTK